MPTGLSRTGLRYLARWDGNRLHGSEAAAHPPCGSRRGAAPRSPPAGAVATGPRPRSSLRRPRTRGTSRRCSERSFRDVVSPMLQGPELAQSTPVLEPGQEPLRLRAVRHGQPADRRARRSCSTSSRGLDETATGSVPGPLRADRREASVPEPDQRAGPECGPRRLRGGRPVPVCRLICGVGGDEARPQVRGDLAGAGDGARVSAGARTSAARRSRCTRRPSHRRTATWLRSRRAFRPTPCTRSTWPMR